MIYSFGEIALVVIGILIALQINNWNQNQLDRKEEKRILASISEEMDIYKWQTERGLNTYSAILNSSNQLLNAVIDTGHNIPYDSLNHHLGVLTSRWMFGKNNNSNIYDALAGSGELGLIRSDELRRMLSVLDRNISLLSVYEDFQAQFVESQLFPFLNGVTDGIKIAEDRREFINQKFGFSPSSYTLPLTKNRFPTHSDKLLNSQKFSNLLVNHIKNTSTLIPIYERLMGFIDTIDSLQLAENHLSKSSE